MHSVIHHAAVGLCLLACSTLFAQELTPQPVAPTLADADARRDAIHQELDGNQATVTGLYRLLDTTPSSAKQPRKYLEAQIQLYEDRSAVLFDQLDTLDQHRHQRDRWRDFQLQSARMWEEAKQLRRAGHVAPAALREAKAKAIDKSLKDGTWKLLAAAEWNCEAGDPQPLPVGLFLQVQQLRAETTALRTEIQQLRETVNQLRRQVSHPAAK